MSRSSSLRGQLLRWLLAPLVLLLAVNAFFSNRAAVATANQAFDRLLMASADAIAEDVTWQDSALVVDLPYAALQLLESNIQERIFYRVVGPDGRTVTGYDDLPLPAPVPGAAVAAAEEVTVYSAPYRGDMLHLVALRKRIYGTELERPIAIIVAETGEARDELSHQILLDGLVRQGLIIAATVVLVWAALYRGLRPLGRLRDSLLRRSATDLTPIDPASAPREVQALIAALNQHTGRIETLLIGRERFIADASHQMRTPLAEMRTQVEYCLRQGRLDLAEETLRDVRAGMDQLARLLGQMLLLARADPAVRDEQGWGRVDLGELARATAFELVPAARRKAIDLGFDATGAAVFVQGNGLLLRELIANLIDNAIVHCPAGAAIEVRVRREADSAVLEVDDNGPGIAPADRERVFDRFYRSPGRQGDGSGLGLAIVRDICVSHAARIELSTPPDGAGLRVRVTFAAADQAPPPQTPAAT